MNNKHLSIVIEKLDVSIDKKEIQIDEHSISVLKYKTPYFRAEAVVKFPPIEENEVWKLGWIQACTQMKFYNTYGSLGYSSWELPELLTGERPMICDSDGKNFPWYGSKNEVVLIKGPKFHSSNYKVKMNDNFCPHVTWDIPTSNEKRIRLTNVKRNQKFYTWLVAMDVVNGIFVVLKTLTWRIKFEIEVNPLKEMGKRAKLIGNREQKQPSILKENIEIPNCALYPCNANSCQVLKWYPNGEAPIVVVSSRCSTQN